MIFFSCFNFSNEKFLVFGGKTGWIGSQIVQLLKEKNYEVICGTSRLENRSELIEEIKLVNPDYIINCAGLTGTPNVDWCEDHQQDVIRTNIIGSLNLFDVCQIENIHLTNFGTGCIYEYDDKHQLYSGLGFSEHDQPNFTGSFYSKTRALVDSFIEIYPNTLNLRLRMPISSDLHPKNFITKITKYKKVINVPNSMTVLDELLPISIDMTLKKIKGNFNFCNPGTISHNEILDLYIKFKDPLFKYENFSIEEQNSVLKAKRSNNELDVSKLMSLYPHIKNIKDSVIECFKKI